MAKKTRSYMVRRGTRYLIERTAEGTFSKWIPVGKTGAKKASAKKSSAKKARARTSTASKSARR